jgi:hypothetical protein
LWIVLSVLLGVFVLLCANEMFGQPPLMTGWGPPPAEFVGTWSAGEGAQEIALTIGPNGAVSGTIAGRRCQRQIPAQSKRVWTPHPLAYGLHDSGRPVSCGSDRGWTGRRPILGTLNVAAPELHGTLFLSHPGASEAVRHQAEERTLKIRQEHRS